MLPGTPLDCNLSKEEWSELRGLAVDHNIIINPGDKSTCLVVGDRQDYQQTDNFRIMKLIKVVVLRMQI